MIAHNGRVRLMVLCLASALLGAGAAGQQPASPGTRTLPQYVPADSLGLVAMPNLAEFARAIDEMSMGPERKPLAAGGMMGILREQLQLAPDFAGTGSFAIVMLDPRKHGVDLLAVMKKTPPGTSAPKNQKLPFVIFLPGSDPKKVFHPDVPLAAAGKYSQAQLAFGPLFVGTVGEFVILSPTTKALDEIVAGGKSIADSVPQVAKQFEPAPAASFRNLLVLHVNMGVLGPAYSDMMKQWEDYVAKLRPERDLAVETPLGSTASMAFRRDLAAQLRDVTMVGRFDSAAGLILSAGLAFDAESSIGKMIQAAEPVPVAQFTSQLPPWPAAIQLQLARRPDGAFEQLPGDTLDKLLARAKEQDRPRLRKLLLDLRNQVNRLEFGCFLLKDASVARSPAPAAYAWVLHVDDAAAAKGLLAELAPLGEGLIRSRAAGSATLKLDGPKPELLVAPAAAAVSQLKIAYVKEADKAGGVSLDAITIESGFSEKEQAELERILGERRVRVLIAAPTDKMLVLTLGGGSAVMEKALLAAKGQRELLTGAEARQHLPKELLGLILYSPANRHELEARLNPGTQPAPPEGLGKFLRTDSKQPVAVALSREGSTLTIQVVLPREMLRQVLTNLLAE